MDLSLIAVLVTDIASWAFWLWMWRCIEPVPMSGDKWYMRRFAFTDEPVSPPYCWRPLLPYLARYLGFPLVTHSAVLATPVVIYYWLGANWSAAACAIAYMGFKNGFSFNIRNPEYADGLGHLLFISGLWAMMAGSPLAFVLLLLAALTRENIALAHAAIALFINPWLILPSAIGVVAAYLLRNEDLENRHPLVEPTAWGTVVRWAKHKGVASVAYAHTIQPIRAAPLIVPFVWNHVAADARVLLWGAIPILGLAIPASGQSRIVCYSIPLFLPFAAALPAEWLWFWVVLVWFWPIDFGLYDESGGKTFGFTG